MGTVVLPRIPPPAQESALFGALPAAVYMTDAAGRITYYNEAAAHLWGCRPEIGKSEFCGSWKLYRPNGTPLPHEECPMALALKQKRPIRGMEAIAERPDGSRVSFLPYPTPLFDASGVLVGALNMLVDITERKRMEEANSALKDKLIADLADMHRLQDISGRLVSRGDSNTLLKEILEAAIEITRADLGNIQLMDKAGGGLKIVMQHGFEQDFLDYFSSVHEGMAAACSVAMQRAERVIVEDIANDSLFKDTPACAILIGAGARSVQSTPLVSRSGELLGMLSTHFHAPTRPGAGELQRLDVLARQAADLIERKQAELTDQLLAAIVDSSQDAIVGEDLDGNITSWNRGAERLFGYRAEEAIGKPAAFLTPPSRHSEEILARIKGGERIEHYETVRLRKNGDAIDISLTVSPIEESSGAVIGASLIARDITEQKRAQQRQELLTQEIHHRTKNLFAVVHAIVARSFENKGSVEEAKAAALERLHSLAKTHFMLIEKEWEGAGLGEVVRTGMAPYGGRATIQGPEITLSAKAAQNFALAVHELATNAAKYGALSNPAGHVDISWSVSRANNSPLITFCWRERGGPPVIPPTRRGFGSAVLERVMEEYFEVPSQIEFAKDGVRYELTASLDAIAADPEDVDLDAYDKTRAAG